MKRVLIVAVCMSIAFLSGRLLAGVSMDGTVITFHVAEGESETYAEKIPPTCTKVIKTGKGTLTVSDAFGGRWRVSRNAAGTSLTLRYIRGTTLLIR